MALAATMAAACGARTDLTPLGEALGVSGSETPSSGSVAGTGLGSSGMFVSAGATPSSGSFVTSGTATAGSLAESGALDAGGPTVLVDNQQSPTYIAVDPNYVYWTTAGSGAILWRAPLAGGAPVAFEKGSSAFGITAQAGFVFAILGNPSGNESIATLTRAASGSSDFQILWSGSAQATLAGPVANSISVYWSDAAAGTIWRMGIDGSDPAIIASGETDPGPLALDAKNLYWLSPPGMRMMPLVGGAVTTLGLPPPSPPITGEAIAVDALAVYSSPLIPPCTVWRTALGGGGSSPLILSTPICMPTPSLGHGVAADGMNVYWTVGVLEDPLSDTGEILRTSPMGGTFTTIASGQAFPFAVTLDSQFVYWTNHGGLSGGLGQVMRAPK